MGRLRSGRQSDMNVAGLANPASACRMMHWQQPADSLSKFVTVNISAGQLPGKPGRNHRLAIRSTCTPESVPKLPVIVTTDGVFH
eukprot:742676-Hanusia_phi.AAC.2